MNKKVKNLFTSIGICVFFGIIGGWLTGDALEIWFKQINQPWYSLPLTGWYSVGCLYYLMIIVILSWFKQINQPWYSLPLTGWYSVGCLYYLMIIVILYRLLNEGGKFKASLLAGERFGERFSRAREK